MNTKLCITLALLVVVAVADPRKKTDEYSGFALEEGPEPAIQPRVTCDVLSPTGWGDAICAGRCILMGYKGGYCNSQKVCTCR